MDDTREINVNSMYDLTPVLLRIIERALVFSLSIRPGATISEIVKRKVEPTLDPDAVLVWDKLKTRLPDVLSLGEPAAAILIYGLFDRRFFWRANNSYEDLGRPEPKVLVDHLIIVQALQRANNYLERHKLLDRVFGGWADL